MKQYILKVAKDLEEGIISEDRAGKLLLGLFGVSGSSVPLTVNKVSEITQEISKETWIAAKGNDEGWQNWWNNRCKININSKKKTTMFNKAKYIRTKNNDIIVFSPALHHSSFKHRDPVSAGFISFGVDKDGNICCRCFGESQSLNLKSYENTDTILANRQILGNYEYE